MFAAKMGNTDCVKRLSAAGAALNTRDRVGETILHHAVRSGNDDLVAYLANITTGKNRKNQSQSHEIKINIRSKKRETALLLARSKDIAMILINHGADPTIRNSYDFDIACIAAAIGNAEMLEAVLCCNTAFQRQHSPRVSLSPRHQPNRPRTNSAVDVASINDCENDDFEQISAATVTATPRSRSNSESIEELPHLLDLDSLKFLNPLHLATFHGNLECVSMLASLFDSSYLTISSSNDCVRGVILGGGDSLSNIDHTDYNTGWSSLQVACIIGHTEILKVLMKHGANANNEDRQGANALVLAAFNNNIDSMKVVASYTYASNGKSTKFDLTGDCDPVTHLNRKLETVTECYYRLKMLQRGQGKRRNTTCDDLDLQYLIRDESFLLIDLIILGCQIPERLLQKLGSPVNYNRLRSFNPSKFRKRYQNLLAHQQEMSAYLAQDVDKCDVIIECIDNIGRKKCIYAHRDQLSQCSGKFDSQIRFEESKIAGIMKKNEIPNSDDAPIVLSLQEFDYDQCLQVVHFVYTGELLQHPNFGASKNINRIVGDFIKIRPASTENEENEETISIQEGEEEEEEETDVDWLLNLLSISDEFLMPGLLAGLIEYLVHAMQKDASFAPIIFVTCLGDLPGLVDLRLFSARCVLENHHVEAIYHKSMSGIASDECRELVELALMSLVVSQGEVDA